MAGATLGDVLVAVAAALRDAKDELNRLDGIAGDGDLGITAGRAADALDELVPTLPADDPPAAARAIGMALARKAPSTGGTLIAFACLAAGKVELPGDTSGLAAAAALLGAGRDEIARRGKVAPGDRTILDAIGPVADALEAAAASGLAPRDAAAAAARAADEGARATALMEATTGRAGWLADRARGHEDAGARLAAIVVAAAAGVVD
jgi:phosphoenolpyruvate---glycerone phosphotransferase subunit DhaL